MVQFLKTNPQQTVPLIILPFSIAENFVADQSVSEHENQE